MFNNCRGIRAYILVAIVLAAGMRGWSADETVGSVKTLTGSPVVVRGQQTIPAALGMHLFEKDLLRTDAQSRVGFILRDGARVSLGPESELAVEKFVFEPGQGKLELLLRMIRGVAAFVSGKITQLSPASAVVETPVGMIGLRGTKFAAALAAR